MKNIIVFGATGTLGTYFVDHLVEEGYNVWAVGRRNVNAEYYKNRNINYAKVDITNADDFEKLPQKNIDSVVQISGAMPSRMKGYKPHMYINVHINGTLNVLEYCRKINVGAFLFLQSHSDVAGYWNTGQVIDAYAPRKLNFRGDHAVYIITKNAAVDLAEHYHQEYGIRTFIFRLPTVYNHRPIYDMYLNGKNVPMGFRYFILKAMNSEPIELWGDPTKAKDIVYVKDFNQLLTKAIESNVEKGIYNVASGKATTLEEQIKGVIEVFSPSNNPSKIIYMPDKPSQNSYLYDIENARIDLGYEPQYDYLTMLKDMKEEMQKGRFDHLEEYDVTI